MWNAIFSSSTPQDSESVQNSKDIAELQARRNALSICSSVVNAAAKLFLKAQSVEGIYL